MHERRTYLISFLRRSYLLLAVLFVVWVVIQNGDDIRTLLSQFPVVPTYVIFVCLALALSSYVARALRWLGYMRHWETTRHGALHSLIYVSGFAFTTFPGKAGELMRGVHLSKLGVPFRFTLCSFVSERLLDVLVVSFVASYFLVARMSVFFLIIPAIVVTTLLVSSLLLTHITTQKIRPEIKVILFELTYLWGRQLLLRSTLLTFLAWALQGTVLFIFVSSLGAEISLSLAVSIYCVSLLLGAASMIPGGIGVTELGIVWLLGLVGVESDVAIVVAVLTRALTLWPAVVCGLLSSIVLKKVISPSSIGDTES
ncbi:YbhN family protein [Vibrio breoganii]